MRSVLSRAPLEDAVVVVVDEVEARPGRLVAARQGDLPPVEGVEPLVVRGRVWHARGDHDAVAVVERDEAAVEGAVVQRVEQKAVRRHESLTRRGSRPRLNVACREQGGNVDARETAGAAVVGKEHAAEVVLVDARANLFDVLKPGLLWLVGARRTRGLELSVVGDPNPDLLELPHRLGHGRVRVGEVLAYDPSVHSGGIGEAETSPVWVARLEVGDLEADGRLRAPDLSGKKLDLGIAVIPVLPGKGRAQVEGERHEGLLTRPVPAGHHSSSHLRPGY